MSNRQIRNGKRRSSVHTSDRRCQHVIRTKLNNNGHSSRRKNSVEDLEAQGIRIGGELGEGSYCKVKEATYDGKDAAVKIITRDQLSTDFESKFLPREIDILSKIDHNNIIKVFKIFSYPRHVFIFMELIERGDVLGFIRNRGRLMEEEACFYFEQMVDAVRYLHSFNIAHRDLKCENIMIDNLDNVKLIDFGFCRSIVNKAGHRELSRTFCGSTAYAAPEVLQGIPYNPIMYDVWSLGCVLFIMVTGTMPFDDSNVRRMVTSQLKRNIRYPSTFNLSKELKENISKMLEPDVIRRATMNQIAKCTWIKKYERSNEDRRLNNNNGRSSSSSQQINLDASGVRSTGTQTEMFHISEEF